jgi:hypothetical protein
MTDVANVLNARHELVFPDIRWLTVAQFVHRLSLKPIYPFAVIDERSGCDSRIFVGKNVPEVRNQRHYTQLNGLEAIGTVLQNASSKKWRLQVTHGSHVHEFDDNFLVLCIDAGADAFHWARARESDLPNFALRGALDMLTTLSSSLKNSSMKRVASEPLEFICLRKCCF